MIPTERALVCAHPELFTLPRVDLRPQQRIGCPVCHSWAAIPFSFRLRYQEAYLAQCVGLTFGAQWAEHIYRLMRAR